MRRMMLAAVFAIVVFLVAAPAAQAQYVPQEWGYVHANLDSTRYNLSRLWDGYNRENDRIWADSRYREFRSNSRNFGSYGSYYPSYYGGYGPDYGPYMWGNRYPYGSGAYRWNSRYGRGGIRPGNVNTWGAVNLGATAIGTVVSEVRADRRHKEAMEAIRETQRSAEAREQSYPASEGPSARFAVVYNGTGECLQVNGVVLDRGGKLTVQNPDVMQVATETGSACKAYAEGIGNDVLLTCRK